MANIPNTEYITVNANGIFVGGKPATRYHGQEIYETGYITEVFAWMQKQNPKMEEFHIGAFATRGEYAKTGNPDGAFGPNAWCRVKLENGLLGPWVFYYTYGSAANCANSCASVCANRVRKGAGFRAAVLGAMIDKQNSQPKQNALTNALKDTDLSQFVGMHTIGAYEVIVRKAQNTK